MGKVYSRLRDRVFKPRAPPSDVTDAPAALPRPPLASEVTEKPSLQVLSANLLLAENGGPHHTAEFDLMERVQGAKLVVRRGQPFVLQLALNRGLQPEQDAVSFIFTLQGVEKPTHGHNTLIAIPLLAHGSQPQSASVWAAAIEKNMPDAKAVRVVITPAADAIIGQWKVEVDTKKQLEGSAVSYTFPDPIYILFNPWCKDDSVYMEGEHERNEYVLNDTGIIWRGSYNRLRPTVWHYAQFEADVLECAVHLVSVVGKMGPASRGDPVRTARAISAAVNSPDDNGAVMGNWSDDYGGGTAPTKWLGSSQILQKYWKDKKPVKYGQCWVFAGVVTTIARALGIPSRPVTNYSSAHDTQSSLTVDYFVNEKAEIMEELNSDSIWNFHVWNEVWMQRPDLSAEYDGWQVVDATPQEQSEDMYRCGPASVAAVKKGEVRKPFDGSFVYAEVNADKVFWRYNGPTQPLKLLRKDMKGIGRFISTKAIGSTFRDDITEFYKYPEESKEERAAMLTALRQSASMFSRYYLNEDFNDMHFDFELRDDIKIGEPFSVVLVMKNRSRNTDHTVTVTLRVDTVNYTGRIKEGVKKETTDRLVKAGAVEEIRMDVSYDEYSVHLVDQASFNIACMAAVKDTQYEYFAQDDFRVRKPDIKFKLGGDVVEGKECTATVSLTNPLPVPLKNGTFSVEGPGIVKTLKLRLPGNLAPQATGSVDFKFSPHFAGKKTLSAKFSSAELDDVDGFLEFMVKEVATPATNGDAPLATSEI
ncbi:annulin isoform X2 [Neocloeon triangulifer]|uniref:annulin isoform X2 n=1 Tax=Neocloeon triangulifer TaxID=2078957 RepID=UPI00286EC812|nr:annulin isoform X2 [Neocloeon triangulifer]